MPADTRDRLVAAAARLFHEQGFAATGVATLLREADVGSGSLYHFFESKEDLLAAVLDRYLELLGPEVMDPVEAEEKDPVGRVFALLARYRHGMEMTKGALGCPIGNLALEVSDGSPELRKRIDANFRAWTGRVRGWLEEAKDRFPKGTDLDALAQLVLSVMEGGLMQVRAQKSLAAFDASVACLRQYFELLGTRKLRR